jgi:hypothetical protein
MEFITDNYYRVIKSVINKDIQTDFPLTKNNLNLLSMLQSNFIHYIELLYDGKLTPEWGANFDPESSIKDFYYANENKFQEYVRTYREAKKRIYEVIKNNIIFIKNFENLSLYLMDFINKFNKKASTGKLKDQYKNYIKVGFFEQYLSGLQKYISVLSDEKSTETDKENALNTIYSTFIHNTIGYNIVHVFIQYQNKIKEYFNNPHIADDTVKFLFHTFTLSTLILRNCGKDESPLAFIKDKSKKLAYQSMSFPFEKEMDINYAREQFFDWLFTNTTNFLNNFSYMYETAIKEAEEEAKKQIEEEKTKETTKPKKKSIEEINSQKKKAKKIAKEKHEEIAKYRELINTYKTLLSTRDPGALRTMITNEGKFASYLERESDTSVILVINFYKAIPEEEKNLFIEEALTEGCNIKDIDLQKVYIDSLHKTSSVYENITEKIPYTKVIEAEKGILKDIYKNNLTIYNIKGNELAKYILGKSFNYFKDDIIYQIEKWLNTQNIDKTINKKIKFKDNGKFQIKRYNYMNDHSFHSFNTPINFYKYDQWASIMLSIKYDIITEKVEIKEEKIEICSKCKKNEKGKDKDGKYLNLCEECAKEIREEQKKKPKEEQVKEWVEKRSKEYVKPKKKVGFDTANPNMPPMVQEEDNRFKKRSRNIRR